MIDASTHPQVHCHQINGDLMLRCDFIDASNPPQVHFPFKDIESVHAHTLRQRQVRANRKVQILEELRSEIDKLRGKLKAATAGGERLQDKEGAENEQEDMSERVVYGELKSLEARLYEAVGFPFSCVHQALRLL